MAIPKIEKQGFSIETKQQEKFKRNFTIAYETQLGDGARGKKNGVTYILQITPLVHLVGWDYLLVSISGFC